MSNLIIIKNFILLKTDILKRQEAESAYMCNLKYPIYIFILLKILYQLR